MINLNCFSFMKLSDKFILTTISVLTTIALFGISYNEVYASEHIPEFCGVWVDNAGNCINPSGGVVGDSTNTTICEGEGCTDSEGRSYCCRNENANYCETLCSPPPPPPPPPPQTCSTPYECVPGYFGGCPPGWQQHPSHQCTDQNRGCCLAPDSDDPSACDIVMVGPCPVAKPYSCVDQGISYCCPASAEQCQSAPLRPCNEGYACTQFDPCDSGALGINVYSAQCSESQLGSIVSGFCCAELLTPTTGCSLQLGTGWYTYTDPNDPSVGGCNNLLTSLPMCPSVPCPENLTGRVDICAWPPSNCIPVANPPQPGGDCGTIQLNPTRCVDSNGDSVMPFYRCSEMDCDPDDEDCRNNVIEGSQCCTQEYLCENYLGYLRVRLFCDANGSPTQYPRDVDGNPNRLYTAIGCIPISGGDEFMGFILGWAIGIAGGTALLLIAFAGVQIMTAAGNPQKVQAGKELLTAAITGFLFVLFSVYLLEFIGINILRIPGL